MLFVCSMYSVFHSRVCIFCFKQKTAYELRISDWSSDVCSSDLISVWLLFSAIASLHIILDFGFSPTFSREIAYGFAGRSLTARKRTVPPSKPGDGNHTEADWSIISSATRTMVWLYRRIAITTFLLMETFGTWDEGHPVGRAEERRVGKEGGGTGRTWWA